MSEVVYPGVPFSTRNPRIPSSVRAHTTATCAAVPLVIQVFSPFNTQHSLCFFAVVSMPAGFGSNPAGMLTTAKKQSECWVLNGEKTWITNGTAAQVAVVWARTEDGIRGFLVEKGTPGYTTSDIHGKW